MTAPLPKNERQRLEALRSYSIVDTEPDQEYDDLTELAAHICEAPLALISLVDEDRQWFKSRFNCDVRESTREFSFCAHAIHSEDLFIIPDLLADERFSDNPFVAGQPHVRFYAGAPLVNPDGLVLGTICVLDFTPRDLTQAQRQALKILSQMVMTKLDLRRKNHLLSETVAKNEAQDRILETLRDSEQRSRLLGDAFSPIHWSMNADLSDFQASERWLEFSGMTAEELAERGWFETVHPEDQSWTLAEIGKAHCLGEAHGAEVRLRHNSGTWRWMYVRAIPLKGGDGKILRWLGTNVDIHEQHEAAAALKISEERLRLALDADHLGTWDTNLQEKIIVWDERGQQQFGINTKESTLAEVLARIHPEDREKLKKLLSITFDAHAENFRTEFRVVWSDGSIHWIACNGRVQYNGAETTRQPTRLTGVNRDITSSHTVDLALRTKTKLLTAVSESLEVFLAQGDWNKSLRRLLRCALEQTDSGYGFIGVLTDDRKELRILTYEGTARDRGVSSEFQAFLDNTFRKEGFVRLNDFDNVFGAVLLSGGPKVSNISQTPDRLGSGLPKDHPPLRTYLGVPIQRGGEVVGMIALANREEGYTGIEQTAMEMLVQQAGVLCDSYRQNQRETALKHDRETLESQLRQSQKMEAVGQLAGGVAHDFNNLLTVITGHAELSLMQFSISDPQRDSLLQIARAGERAAQLTRQLLTFSRRQLFQPCPVNLNPVIVEVVKMLQRMVGENMDIQLDLAPDLSCIQADAGMIEQVLMNFVVNARDAMPRGGRILIKTRESEIDQAYCESRMDAKPGRCVAVSVSDTGSGITPEELTRIFEPFYTTKEVGAGTGLGLATVYGIVQQHAGWIDVESELGVGTTFTVFIPATTAAAEKTEIFRKKNRRGGHETILLVEDEEFVRHLAKQILEDANYIVLEAVTGAEALEIWENNYSNIDLLLTDMVMPGKLSGRDVADKILQTSPHLPVIYSSGYSQELLKSTVELREGIHFLPKPYRPTELMEVVRTALDHENAG